MNTHNALIENGYTLENGSILELESKKRYVVCKYDADTMRELNETSNRTFTLGLAGMMGIRQELLPTCVCQFYPADVPRTWYIAFFRIDARKIDSLSNPVDGRNVATVLDQFQRKGLGESLAGALWYSKMPDGYFAKNPHANETPGVPSLTEFLADEQEGWKSTAYFNTGLLATGQMAQDIRVGQPLDPLNQVTMDVLNQYVRDKATPGFVQSVFGSSNFQFGWNGYKSGVLSERLDVPTPGRLRSDGKWVSAREIGNSDKPPDKSALPLKPNKLGRQIDLEEE